MREGEDDTLASRGRKPGVPLTASEALDAVKSRDRGVKAARTQAVAKRGAAAGKKARGGRPAPATKGRAKR